MLCLSVRMIQLTLQLEGRAGKIAVTRELIPHESYRLVYEVEGEIIWVLPLVHTARMWPPIRD